ncbi:MAG: ScyD/ScyE family protein [Solirubrobacterales bacterium]|nr:ScyD/ScyE family protein [Solirubrobacterales bacterium]
MSLNPVRRRPRRDALLAIGLGAAIACTATATAGAAELDVVAEGLSNPRGMTFGPDGRLYVAEAGKGGFGACIQTPQGKQCYGATGAITRVNVRSGRMDQIVKRLPSLAVQAETTGDPDGDSATGPHDISFDGDRAYFTVGLGANPAARADLGPAGPKFAGLYRIGRRGKVSRVADLGAYEAANNPDSGQPDAMIDSNPFSVDASAGERILVTDAGGNDLLRVRPDGKVTTLAVFRPFKTALAPAFLGLPPGTKIPYQPVPTGVVRAPGQGAYVGQLTGFPFPVGEASVYRVRRGRTTVKAGGFTNIIDVGFAGGNLYVLQITSKGLLGGPSPGKLVKIEPDGTRVELAAGKLMQPTGLAVSDDRDVYVGNHGTSGTDGEIVRIPAEDG